jgi:hypothetical protein
VAAGVVFGALAASAHSAAVNDTAAVQAISDQSTAQTFAVVANVMFIAGGTLALVGVIWGIFDVRVALTHSASVHATLSPTGLALQGSF